MEELIYHHLWITFLGSCDTLFNEYVFDKLFPKKKRAITQIQRL